MSHKGDSDQQSKRRRQSRPRKATKIRNVEEKVRDTVPPPRPPKTPAEEKPGEDSS